MRSRARAVTGFGAGSGLSIGRGGKVDRGKGEGDEMDECVTNGEEEEKRTSRGVVTLAIGGQPRFND